MQRNRDSQEPCYKIKKKHAKVDVAIKFESRGDRIALVNSIRQIYQFT